MSTNLKTDYQAQMQTNQTEENIIDIKQIVAKIIQNWGLFFISIIICLVLAVIYARYSQQMWHVSSKILVKDDKAGPVGGGGGGLSGEIGMLFNAKSNADNEIQILKSRTLMQKTVESMQLNVRTYQKNGFKRKEVYEDVPFEVIVNYKADTLKARAYEIDITSSKEFIISNSEDDLNQKSQFGQTIHLKQYDLALKFKPGAKLLPEYEIVIHEPDATVDDCLKAFSASLSDKQASMIDLTFNYPSPTKGEAILNKFMQIYLLSNLQNEKEVADSTYKFINSRIELVSRELNDIEKQFELYKTENNIANISEQSKTLVASASNYYDKLAQQETQLTIIRDLERYLKDPQNKNVIPSSLINPADLSFGQAINAYNELLRSRDRALLSYTESNPIVENINTQLNNSRLTLLKNIETYKQSLVVGRQQLEKENRGFTGKLKSLPTKERNYLDFSRQQNLKQELYLYLLQKREETAISRKSTISSSRIVDVAKSDFFSYKPRRSVIFLIGLIAGVVLPALYLFFSELLNVRIYSKNDIEGATNVPILGEIGHNSDKQSLVTGANSRSVVSEQFRSLRTNLQFVIEPSKSNVLLFTSSMSGEGKSFLSLNIGSALALTNKKVVFLEMDLRKPKLSESIGLTINNGYTNYAISEVEDYDFKKLLKPLSFDKNCFLISSGPIPPNPTELLVNGRLEKLMKYLKGEFDYIIIDCAPIGLVTDALMLEKYADLTFYVIRQGFTYKSQLAIVNDLNRAKKVKSLYLIVNDIKIQRGGYSSYGQSYGYGGYGIEESTNWWSKLKFWKR